MAGKILTLEDERRIHNEDAKVFLPCREPAAQMHFYDHRTDKEIVADCLQCGHCARLFRRYKGRLIGKCGKCGGWICCPACEACHGRHHLAQAKGGII